MLRNGGLSWLNSISLSFSNKFQPNLVMKCIFDCLTVVRIFVQKSSHIAEIPTRVVGGATFDTDTDITACDEQR